MGNQCCAIHIHSQDNRTPRHLRASRRVSPDSEATHTNAGSESAENSVPATDESAISDPFTASSSLSSPPTSFGSILRPQSLPNLLPRHQGFMSGPTSPVDIQPSEPVRGSSNISAAQDPEHEKILDRLSLLRLQIDGLRELNAQSKAHMDFLLMPNSVPSTQQRARDIQFLMNEINARHYEIKSRRQTIRLIELELRVRGLATERTQGETAFVDEPEDESLCNYCMAQPVSEVYTCCNHGGACRGCVKKMQQSNPRCPHCRCPNPVVLPLNVHTEPAAESLKRTH